MAKRVVVTDHIFPDVEAERQILEDAGAAFELLAASTPAEVIEQAGDPAGIMTTYTDITDDVFSELPSLEFVSVYGIGVDMVDIEAATEHGVVVFHVPDYCVEEVANHTVGLILTAERRLYDYCVNVEQGGWDWEVGRPIQRLSDKTVGIVGLGRIGSSVAERIQGFGVEILSYDPYLSEEHMAEFGVQKVEFDELCERADIITVHSPLDDSTEHLLDDDAFELMGNSTTLINAARGPIVDEEALARALEQDHVNYAALDVLEDEPPEDDHPFRDRDNVIMTPHVAWYSEGALDELQRETAKNAARAVRGDELQNVVNPSVLD